MTYRPLETSFSLKSFTYTQVERVGYVAIYKVTREPWNLEHFEVIRIKTHDGYEICGNKFEPAEMYPSSAQWGGNIARSFGDLNKAKRLLEIWVKEDEKGSILVGRPKKKANL